jgi:hypothetical protein
MRDSQGVLDSELVQFIQSTFRSVWSLEMLVFLHRHPGQTFSVDALIREVRGSRPVVLQSLEALQAGGLVVAVTTDDVRFAPASADLARLADGVVGAYRDRPGEVRRLVLSAPNEKLHTFADAFRLRKDPS